MKERRAPQPVVVRCKLVLVGDVQCGKTAMLQVLAKDCYPEVSFPAVPGSIPHLSGTALSTTRRPPHPALPSGWRTALSCFPRDLTHFCRPVGSSSPLYPSYPLPLAFIPETWRLPRAWASFLTQYLPAPPIRLCEGALPNPPPPPAQASAVLPVHLCQRTRGQKTEVKTGLWL